jgi:hypothetical protein
MDKLVEVAQSIINWMSIVGIVSGIVSVILGAVALLLAHRYYEATKTSEVSASSILAEIKSKTDLLSKITDRHLGRLTDIIEKGFVPQQQQPIAEQTLPEKPRATANLDLSPDETKILELVRRLHPNNEEAQINQIIKWGQDVSTQLSYEKTYRIIFGSQMHTLNYLNTYGPQPLMRIKGFYDEISLKFPEVYTNFSFDAWVQFLLDSSLIEKNDDNVLITAHGNGFLVYLKRNQISEQKPY